MTPRSSEHAFRYEQELCTLPEGKTLRDWRRDEAPGRGKRRLRGLLARRRARRAGA
ncbi:MAG: hypothetical protein HZB46_05365 [Solirubrobacterales bacterium]|nr:hypothetical protein [Solirubrobacterales bacterium]